MRATPASSAVPSLCPDDSSTSMASSPRTPLPEPTATAARLVAKGMNNDETNGENSKGALESNPEDEERAKHLKFLIEKSTIYARIVGDRMERQQVEKLKAEKRAAARNANKEKRVKSDVRHSDRERKATEAASAVKRRSRGAETSRASKRAKIEEDPEEAPVIEVDTKPEAEDEDGKQYSFEQPALVTGAKLRDYQLAGVQWMISLYENGLNGILADEMGLGKTLQTISFFAHLRSKGTWGPFLVVCPLSVLHNWITEFEKFAPDIPVVMYHGTPEQRAELRASRLQAPPKTDVGNVRNVRTKNTSGLTYAKVTNTTQTFPIIVTTYEICMIDQKQLSGLKWKFIVVDEGHRLKNMDCKLIRELKSYKSANRMILTGTPLHNNLGELWSLLNFILPDIFDDLDAFQQWFNLDEMDGSAGLLDKTSIVQSLHAILKPFLLRRLKSEVERDLPPKKEYLLYAPLTQKQKDIYQAILNRNIRDYLIGVKSGEEEQKAEVEVVEETDGRPVRKRAAVNYNYDDLFERKEPTPEPVDPNEVARRWQIEKATKSVNNMRLQNLVMQLRKVSSHPFLFDWPIDQTTGDYVVNDDLVNASGKMLLLNRLLDALFAKGHKVLIFSQFTTMLNVIEDWATEFKGINICRIDGATSQQVRREQMKLFNERTGPNAPNLFLLSTRAGGLGINLVAADTVIFFDQDWNPQMDLQAQDRAHRIGQTKPVLVFRLVSQHTIETSILQKASNKRKLEALVIQQGKFGKVVDENGRVLLGRTHGHKESTADWARALLDLDGEEVSVATAGDTIISDADLETLLDRSPAAYAREKGWAAGLGKVGDAGREEQLAKGEKTAFEVFVPAKDEAADGLAHMFGGDGEADE